MERDATRLARGSAYLVTHRLLNSVIAAVALAFIARILTQPEMGVVVALTLTREMANVLSDLGFGKGLTKYVAEYKGKEVDYTFISFGAVLTKALMSSCAAVVCYITAPWLSFVLVESQEYAFVFQLLSVVILTFGLRHTLNDLLLGVNKMKEIAILNVVSESIGKISAVGMLLCGFGLVGIVVAWILSGLIFVVLGFSIIIRNRYVRIHPAKDVVPYLKILARFSWPLFLTSIVVFAYDWFDQFILFAYVPLSELAIYNVTDRAFIVLTWIPIAISATLLPYYSEQFGKDEKQKIVTGVEVSSRYITLGYTPLALGLMAIANPAIIFFAGPSYASGDLVLGILCLFGALTGLTASFGILLLVFNMTPTFLLVNIASVVGSSVFSPILLPHFGILGMAFIRGAAMMISLILVAFALRRHLSINLDKEALWKSWCGALVMVVAIWVMQTIYLSPYLLPVYIILGGMTYMFSLRLLKTVNKNDLKLARNLLGKRIPLIADILEKILL